MDSNEYPTRELWKSTYKKSYIYNLIRSRHPDFTLPFLKGNGKMIYLPLAKIKYIEPEGPFCKLCMGDYERKNILIAQSIGDCERQLLPFAFIRIHRKILLNLSWLHTIENNNVKLVGDTELPIARRRSKEVKKQLAAFGLLFYSEKKPFI